MFRVEGRGRGKRSNIGGGKRMSVFEGTFVYNYKLS
jgi:hypothetical protein